MITFYRLDEQKKVIGSLQTVNGKWQAEGVGEKVLKEILANKNTPKTIDEVEDFIVGRYSNPYLYAVKT